MNRLAMIAVYVLLCGCLVNASPPRTNNLRPQHVPRVRYGGNPPRYIAPRPPSYVYRLYEYPPTATPAKIEDTNRGRPVDWDAYNTIALCPVCGNHHAGGSCVPPKGRATEVKTRK